MARLSLGQDTAASGRNTVGMAGGASGTFRLEPSALDQPPLVQTNEDRIEAPGFQPRGLGDLQAVEPVPAGIAENHKDVDRLG